MASLAAWLPFARAAAIGWAPLARKYSFCNYLNHYYILDYLRSNNLDHRSLLFYFKSQF